MKEYQKSDCLFVKLIFFILLIIFFIGLGTARADSFNLSPQLAPEIEKKTNVELYKKLHNSIVQIYMSILDRNSSGSGVFVQQNMVITNYHVVRRAIEKDLNTVVVISGRNIVVGTIVSHSEERDLALLRLDALKRNPAKLGSSYDTKIGDTVITIGYPLGMPKVLGVGVLTNIMDIKLGDRTFPSVLQTNATVLPGSSGGALFNHRGELIGITFATTRNSGLGYAIRVEYVKEMIRAYLLKQLKKAI